MKQPRSADSAGDIRDDSDPTQPASAPVSSAAASTSDVEPTPAAAAAPTTTEPAPPAPVAKPATEPKPPTFARRFAQFWWSEL